MCFKVIVLVSHETQWYNCFSFVSFSWDRVTDAMFCSVQSSGQYLPGSVTAAVNWSREQFLESWVLSIVIRSWPQSLVLEFFQKIIRKRAISKPRKNRFPIPVKVSQSTLWQIKYLQLCLFLQAVTVKPVEKLNLMNSLILLRAERVTYVDQAQAVISVMRAHVAA